MKRSAELRKKFAAKRAEAEAVQNLAEKNEDGELTPEQQARFDALLAEMDGLKVKIEAAEKFEDGERFMPAASGGRASVRERFEDDPEALGFQTPRQLLTAVMENAGVKRVEDLSHPALRAIATKGEGGVEGFLLPHAFAPKRKGMQAAVGSDEQAASQDRYGGFLVGETLVPTLLQVNPEADPTAGLTQPIPMDTPTVKIPARVDKNHASSVSGGLTVGRRAELATFGASRTQMERVTLTAAMLAGLSYDSEEIITDSIISFVAIIEAGMRQEFPAKKFDEKLRGLGGDQYTGILTALAANNAGPTISIAKETGQASGTIVAQNVINMRSRCWGYGQAIWLANHACYPTLRAMSLPVGVAGQLVYQPNLVEGRPDMLEGRPIFYTEFCSDVGTQGDLICANMSQFLEGIYQPMQSASSVHVRFETHEQTFKFWERNAGAPWWRTALTPKKATTKTLSPFVVIDNR